MDKEFRKWMKWYGKKHAEYTVSENEPQSHKLCFPKQPPRAGLLSRLKHLVPLVSSPHGGGVWLNAHNPELP